MRNTIDGSVNYQNICIKNTYWNSEPHYFDHLRVLLPDQGLSQEFPDEDAANGVAILHQLEQMLAAIRSGRHLVPDQQGVTSKRIKKTLVRLIY